MGVLVQVLCTGVVCYVAVIVGLMVAWPSSTLKLFESQNTTLHRPLTSAELALFGSLSSIGALVSTPVAGYALDRLGRKYSTIASSLTHVIAWSMIVISNRVEVMLTAAFISGIGGAIFLIATVYIAEFCQESIRGAMTSSSMLFYALGMLISYLLGGYLEYYTMIRVCLSLSIFGVLLLWMLKESPVFLMQRSLEEDAAKSIAFYRRTGVDSKEVLREMDAIRRSLNPELEGSPIPEEEHLKPEQKSRDKLSLLQFIKKSKSTRQALFVTLVLCTASIFQGLVVVQVYAEPLFIQVVPTMSPTVGSIILAVVTIVTGMLAAYLVDAIGRRALMFYSSAANVLCCIILGSQIQLQWGPHWVTALTIYVYCALYSQGPATVPFVLIGELFLPEVKSFISMVSMEWVWVCNFGILFIFNPLVAGIGLGPVFYIFAAICAATAVFTYIYLPETKGLPVDEIQGLF